MLKSEIRAGEVIHTFEIDLGQFDLKSREGFEDRWHKFLDKLEPEACKIYDYRNQRIQYQTELLIPRTNPGRRNLVLVIGNPADHSVRNGMFFSYARTASQDKWREHPFWIGLREAGILRYGEDLPKPEPGNLKKINRDRRNALLSGDYSPFNLFLYPYYSFPTPASGYFSGVDGIRKLLSKKIFRAYERSEAARFAEWVRANNLKHLICFHKPAIKQIKINHPQGLNAHYAGKTYLMHTVKGVAVLRKLKNKILKK